MTTVTSTITAGLSTTVTVRCNSPESLLMAAAHFTETNSPGDIAAIFDRRLADMPVTDALSQAVKSAVSSSFILDIGLAPEGSRTDGQKVIVSIDVDEPVPTIMLAKFVHEALNPARLRSALTTAQDDD